MSNANKTFRTILQNLTCDRYFSRDEAVSAIAIAFDAGQISETERKMLTQAVK